MSKVRPAIVVVAAIVLITGAAAGADETPALNASRRCFGTRRGCANGLVSTGVSSRPDR